VFPAERQHAVVKRAARVDRFAVAPAAQVQHPARRIAGLIESLQRTCSSTLSSASWWRASWCSSRARARSPAASCISAIARANPADQQRAGNAKFTFVSESHGCGDRAEDPGQTVPAGKDDYWTIDCAVGFWGSFRYTIGIPGNANFGTIDQTDPTFRDSAHCSVSGDAASHGCYCVAADRMNATNANTHWENWHYQLEVGVFNPH
jgi:hypothetical protein